MKCPLLGLVIEYYISGGLRELNNSEVEKLPKGNAMCLFAHAPKARARSIAKHRWTPALKGESPQLSEE
jgi:hypothetical protein